MMKPCLDLIPGELKTGIRHVAWRYEGNPSTKVLKIAGTLRNASSTDPKTWRSFEECVAAMERHPDRYAGVGRVIAKGDPFVGVDLDDVRDPETGRLTGKAEEIVQQLDSYAEVSPSEKGVKLWVRAELDRAYKKPGVEVYPHGRYFTLTGWMLPQPLPTVEERQEELEALVRDEFPEPEKKPSQPYEGKPEERIDLSGFLAGCGVEVLREIPDGTAERVYGIVCPWSHEHSGGDTSGTRVGQYADGALWFRCEHAHCACRGWTEFREFVALSPPRCGKVYARREEVVVRHV
ncbi:MAG: hypothetical protein M3118_01725 [Actinomycetota bacterium]|nr:hypothetical protein [Actinomycetota bacterium]